MIQQVPKQFQLAQYMEAAVIQQMDSQKTLYKTPISFSKNHQDTFGLVMSRNYLSFGMLQKNQIAFVFFIPLAKDLYFEKIITTDNQKSQITGFKLIYKTQILQVYLKGNKKNSYELIQQLAKKQTQVGFHEQFRPVRKLGKGGFATVYQVKRILDSRDFAVKAFSKAHAFSTPMDKATLENQIGLLKQIHQNNLLSLYQVFQSDNSLYLVMQKYDGGDLVTLIQKTNANFLKEQICYFMRDVLKGLQTLQCLKIMHRDLKPQNIMIRNLDGNKRQLVIVDFGLASHTDLQTYILGSCGTPGYVSPQVIYYKIGNRLTSKCDLFSLGVIFHIFLCKSHIFNGATSDEVFKKNKACQFDLNTSKYQSLDSNALDLMKRMLIVNPDERISASQALQHPYFWQNGVVVSQKTNQPDRVTIGSATKIGWESPDYEMGNRAFY